jgi:membrane protease YdiL (CAAX protease family)
MTRRRLVVLATLVVGTASLTLLLRLEPGDDRFAAGAAWAAAVWALGAVLAGPVAFEARGVAWRAVRLGALVGTAAVVTCIVGGLVAAHVPALRDPASALLDHAEVAVVALALANAVAEELFFRGALYDAVPPRLAVATTTVVYAVTTLGSGVALLTVAAVVLGLVTALLRQATGGVLAPAAAHLTWSTGMLLVLPSILGNGR